ncbi:hypothetical protein M9Y10_001592 [Tritrichomonas musculus]|uniref:Protein kinase domain-containing protein n=1 Tax=Tritrichomonas musculus TaxID=1915356 RepID=A0ABR2L7E2_9EUKA
MFEMPDKRKNYVLMSEKANEFDVIKDISPKYPHIYAFELPEAGPSRGNVFVIIRLVQNGGFYAEPMLCEVKRGHIPNKLTLKRSIQERIKNLFDARLKFEIPGDLTFFMPSGDNPSICEQFISVNISEGSLRYNIKAVDDKSAKLSLKSLFNGFIKLSLYDKEVKCNGCGKVSRPFARYRITDFPKIVVFRIDCYETQNSNLFQLQIPEFVAFGCDTNGYNTFDSLADPSLYKGLNISGVTLYELRATINRNSNNQFTAAGKRGDKWYEFNDTLVNPVDDPSEASGTPYILFYEIIGDEKQPIKYFHNSTRSMIANIDRSVQTNASEIIDFFRDKTKDPTISGFKYNGKTYRYGDTTSVNGIFPIGRKEDPQIELIVSNAAYRPSPPSSPQSPKNPPKSHDMVEISSKNYEKIVSRVRFLESNLSKIKQVGAFNFNSYECDIESSQEVKNYYENPYIGEESESFYIILEDLEEGELYKAFKVIDKRNLQIMFKKVLKTDENIDVETIQNSIKEFETLFEINHQCICKCFGINFREKIDDAPNKTSIGIYLEYLDYNLKNFLDKGILSNTMKVKICVEVASGMSCIHKRGIIHRNLNTENIMMNKLFEAKVINFGFAHLSETYLIETNTSLTKNIGDFVFMSPEMQGDDDYDNKTDVFSFGVVLYNIFTGQVPNITMKDRINKIPPTFPSSSPMISECCIELIKKCMSYDVKERPTFDEILDFMKDNLFKLADEVDIELISQRYKELNQANND